jgi:hypothetical protein
VRLALTVAAVAVSLAAVPAVASQNSNDNNNRPADRERKICRSAPDTGSILAPRRQCRTQAEWDELSRRAERTLQRSNENTGTSSMGGN